MKGTIDQEVAKAMKTVRRRKIFDQAIVLIRHFGNEHSTELSDGTSVRGECSVTVGDFKMRIREESHGHYHDRLEVKISVGEELVFCAIRACLDASDVDPRRVFKSGTGVITVEAFKAGDWLKWMSVSRIERRQKAIRAARDRAEIAEAVKQEAAERQEARESDEHMALRFGLK
jgi:hypothetical protein